MIVPQDEKPQGEAAQGTRPTFQYKRFPAVPRSILDINPEKDIRVRLLGRVIDKQNDLMVLDDGTSSAEIIVEKDLEKINTGDVVRVFCRVLPLETNYELRAEIIQNMNGFDTDLYRKIVDGAQNDFK